MCHIKSDDQLKQENKSLVEHVKDLVKKKYDQDITKDDIKACFRLKKGGILVKFWKNGKGSKFQTLSSNIKSSKGSVINLFFNVMLTGRRGELLFEIRKLKKDNKISSSSLMSLVASPSRSAKERRKSELRIVTKKAPN